MNRFNAAPGAQRRLAVALALAAFVLMLDQFSKQWVLRDWPESQSAHIAVLPFIDLVLRWNHGVSFSIGDNLGPYDRLVFGALAIGVSIGLLVWIARGVKPLILVSLGFVIGGALGNGLDRLRLGAVEDFIYVHIGAFDWWPVFNVADSAICVGAALMIFDSLFDRTVSHKNTP
jgi:signal peptidase II